MQKEYNKFKELLETRETNKATLLNEIEVNQEEVKKLDDEYNQALTVDNDDLADTIQDKTYNLNKVIQRNQRKIKLIDGEGNEELKQAGLKVLTESNEALASLSKESETISDEYHGLRESMVDKARELQEHRKKGQPYINAVSRMLKEVPAIAEEQNNQPRSRISVTKLNNGRTISNYGNTVKNPTLKTLNYHELREILAGI